LAEPDDDAKAMIERKVRLRRVGILLDDIERVAMSAVVPRELDDAREIQFEAGPVGPVGPVAPVAPVPVAPVGPVAP